MTLQVTKESFGVIETSSVASTVQAADAAIKGALIDIIEIRMADSLGGKAFVMVNGKIQDVEAAVEIGMNAISNKALWRNNSIIPFIDPSMASEISETTRFKQAPYQKLPGGEEQ